MRITSTRIIDLQAAAMDNAQTQVGQLGDEASSGLRVTSPSQDPTAWLASHRATLRATISAGVGTAMQYGSDVLDQTSSALTTIESTIAQVRQLAVQGANATYNATDRANLATQVQGLFASALAAANTQTPDGEYVLAGAKSLTSPFDAAGVYHGDASTRALPTSATSTSPATIPGSDLTATNGVDVLPLLQQVATALASNDMTALTGTLTSLDTAQQQVTSLSERAGIALTAIDNANTARTQLEQNLTTSAANYVDADAVSVASQLAQASNALQTTQAVSAHVISILTQATGG